MKKKIIIILSIIALIIIGIIIYFFINKQKNATNQKSIIKISEASIYSPKLKDKIIYFTNQDKSEISSINLETRETKTLAKLPQRANSISWANEEDLLIYETIPNDYGYYELIYYDLKNKTPKYLDKNILEFAWSQDDKLIYYNFFKSDDEYDPNTINTINSSSPDGSNWQNILDLKMPPPKKIFLYPDNSLLLVSDDSGYQSSDIFYLDLSSKELTNLTRDGFAKEAKYVIGSDYIIFSTDDKKTQKIFSLNLKTKKKEVLPFNYIEMDKITLSPKNNFLIVAVPQKENNNYDFLHRVDLDSNKISTIFESTNQEHYSANNLMISDDQKNLYFTSDNLLYKLDL